jgi:RNA polymerase sigma-70 factor (ECF subfamily)
MSAMTDSGFDDAILIERSQTGDRAAFNALILKHEARAYHYAFRLTRNAEEASDVVGEAFVRIYNALKNFKGNSSFPTWMYRILTNCFLDLRKKDKSKLTTSLDQGTINADSETPREIPDSGPGPEEQTEKSERQLHVESAVNSLPEYQRAMIVMYHAENLSYDEIAAALDLPVGTVKSRLNRARLVLREILLKHEELFQQ